MRALVVYESQWGNTEEVGRAIGRGLREGGAIEVEVADVVTRRADLTDLDLLVAGGPTHAFSMSRPSTRRDARERGARAGHEDRGLREWLAALAPSADVAVATYDTRARQARHLPGSAARKAAKEVRHHHLGTDAGSESFYVADVEGPLLEGEVERAEAWGRALAAAAGGRPAPPSG